MQGEVDQNTWFVVEQDLPAEAEQLAPELSESPNLRRLALDCTVVGGDAEAYSAFDMPTLNARWLRACAELGGEFTSFSQMKALADMAEDDVAEIRQRAWGV